ncbi:unnamed protein product [Peniophora sp. CBMAI 1063]|nr:unnamed protein product [Peniophora sp. CBMAI 1063]
MITPQPTSSIDVVLDSGSALLLGATADASPALLRGRVILELAEPMRIQEVSVRFRGRASVPAVSESLGDADAPSAYTVCSENWLLFESASPDDSLPAGTHTYPFKTFIGGSLPASTTDSSPRGVSVVYSLRAMAVRANKRPNLRHTITVPVLRSFPSDSLEFFQSLDHEHTIPGQLSYSLSLPHKAWAAGDTLSAIFHASMHTKEVSIRAVKTCVTQTRRVLKHGEWERQVETIASGSHYVHNAPEGTRVLKSILGNNSKRTRHVAFAEEDEGYSSGSTLSPVNQLTDRDISVVLDLPIPPSTSPSHSVAPIYVDHHVSWTLTIVDASGKARDHHCRLPLHILDHRLLLETVAATLASRLQALNGSPSSSSDSTELPEVHTPPSYQAHVQDRVPELYVLPEVAERSSSLLNIIPPPRSADFSLAPPASATPSYEDAAKGFLGGLPPLELLRQLPRYAEV